MTNQHRTLAAVFASAESQNAVAAAQQTAATTPQRYAREAHVAHLLADALADKDFSPLLETDYKIGYRNDEPSRAKLIWPRADVWCPRSRAGANTPIFMEVKLARVEGDNASIGSQHQRKILAKWALDVYKLLACAERAHCAFVVSVSASGQFPEAPCADSVSSRNDVTADDVYDSLMERPVVAAGLDAVTDFGKACSDLLGATTSWLVPVSPDQRWQALMVVEWLQDEPASSKYSGTS